MTNYEYILNECKRAYHCGWKEDAVNVCIEKLEGLSRSELMRLFTSLWLEKKTKVREAIFYLLFGERLKERDRMIREASIEELGEMLTTKDGNYVKLARKELKDRYQTTNHSDQMLIISFFLNGTTKMDIKWGEVRTKWQERGYANPPSIFETLKMRH